jgi:Tfp pilus assembly protein PilE
MAGVSFMARSTEKGVEDALHEHANRMEKHFTALSARMDEQIHSLQQMLVMQQKIILENHSIMKRQQETIQDQGAQLLDLMKLQEDLKVRVQSLQADMTVIRYQRLDSNHRNGVEKESTKDDTPIEQPPYVLEIGTQARDIEEDDDAGDDTEVNYGIVDGPVYAKEELYEQNIHLKNVTQRTTQETDQRALTCGPVIEPRSVGCSAFQSPGDDSDINEVGYGVVDEPVYTEEELYQQNIRLKQLIQKTALEMDQTQASCGPKIEATAVGCAPLHLPDDKILFNKMMLSDEEMMLSLRLSKRGQMEMEEPEEQCGKEDGENGEDEEGCINIEVTLMDEDEGQEAEEQGKEGPADTEVLETEGDEEDEADEDATVTTANMKKDELEIPLDEKKEMDPSDTPDLEALIVREKTETANRCSVTNPLSLCGT